MMIQYLTYVVLVFVLILKTIFPFGMIRQTTATETGSLAATDALGRQAVSAGESKKKVGIFYFLWLPSIKFFLPLPFQTLISY